MPHTLHYVADAACSVPDSSQFKQMLIWRDRVDLIPSADVQ